MSKSERRKYKRLPLTLDLLCRKVGSKVGKPYTGCTVNIGPGGLYFETSVDTFQQGNLLSVELSIPPTTGLLELGGRISSTAKVLRTHNIRDISRRDDDLYSARYGIALEFCRPPRLCP